MRARVWSVLLVLLPGCGSVEYGAIEYGDEYVAAPSPAIGTSPAPAEATIEIETFYQELAPYGDWLGHPSLGQVFVPHDPDYRPYRNGHWAQDGDDLVWVSYDAIGWAVCHYGSWTVLEDGRWAWVPGTEWSPAWVEWRETEQYVGWAPRMVVVQPDPMAWIFVESAYLLYDSVAYYSVQPTYLPTVYASGRPMARRPGRRWLRDRGVGRAVAGGVAVRPRRGPPPRGVPAARGGSVVVRDGIPNARGGSVVTRGPARAPLLGRPGGTVVLDQRGRTRPPPVRVEGPVATPSPRATPQYGPTGPRVVRPAPMPSRVVRPEPVRPAPRYEAPPRYEARPRYEAPPRVYSPPARSAPVYQAPRVRAEPAPRYEAPSRREERRSSSSSERRSTPARSAPVGGAGRFGVRPR